MAIAMVVFGHGHVFLEGGAFDTGKRQLRNEQIDTDAVVLRHRDIVDNMQILNRRRSCVVYGDLIAIRFVCVLLVNSFHRAFL